MYLFDHYMDEDVDTTEDQGFLATELAEAGFDRREIDKAFAWLEDLGILCEQSEPDDAKIHNALRHYTNNERQRLGAGARGLLQSLENRGILNPHTREMVIDRVMALDAAEIEVEQLKWVVMMVLYNQPDRDNGAAAWVEDMVYEEASRPLH
jgi:Smg protein